ncbi:O-antigen ligase family protein [Pseudomonadota bacterium]
MGNRILRRKGEVSPSRRKGKDDAPTDLTLSSDFSAPSSKMKLEHWAWVLLFFNLIRFLPRGHDVTGLDPHSSYRILLVIGASILVMLSLVANSRSLIQFARPPLLFLLAYSLVAIGSSLTASVAFYSLWKAIEMLVLTGCIAALLGMPNFKIGIGKAYQIMVLLLGVFCFSPWLSAILAPSQAFQPQAGLIPVMLYGVIPPVNPNTLGFLSSVTGLVLTARFMRHQDKRYLYGALWFLAMVTLFMSNSRTGIAAYILGVVAYSIVDNRKNITVLVMAFGLVIILVGPVRDLAGQYLQRGQHIESVRNMSGRASTWKVAYEYFLKSPYVGHGYAAAGRFDVLGNASSHLHGTIFEVMVGLGLMGLVPFLLWVIFTGVLMFKAWRNVRQGYPDDARSVVAEWSGLFVILIIRSTTSSGLYAHNIETMLFGVLMAALMAEIWREVGKPSASR